MELLTKELGLVKYYFLRFGFTVGYQNFQNVYLGKI
jgi:hypothetical protein